MASQRDHEHAHAIAMEAGQRLLRLRAEQLPDVTDAAAVNAFAKLADRTSDDWILARIREEFPDDAILSEETEDDLARLGADRCWIVDPVDGTWEYSHNRSDFAVHIALWERGRGLTAGTVAVPANGEHWSTYERGTHAHRSALPTDRHLRVVVSRTRPLKDEDAFVRSLAAELAPLHVPGVTLVRVGSVGAKVGEVLAGRVDAYVSESGFYEWDGAAPAVVAAHAGLIVSQLDGSPHTYNNANVKMPGYVVAPSWLAQHLYRVLVARRAGN
ncbi:MAG: 3'(2'),5'-bisphosphate nucleotidase CysQ [Candidatus Nanopelagicales bacterium]